MLGCEPLLIRPRFIITSSEHHPPVSVYFSNSAIGNKIPLVLVGCNAHSSNNRRLPRGTNSSGPRLDPCFASLCFEYVTEIVLIDVC